MRRRKKPEKATKKEPWLDGPKALVSGAKAPKLTISIAYLERFVMKDKKKFWNVVCWMLTGFIWVYFIWKWFF